MKDIAMSEPFIMQHNLCYFKYLSPLSKLSHQSLKMLKTNPESFQNAVQPSKLIFDRIHKSPCSCCQPTSLFLCFPASLFGNSTCMFSSTSSRFGNSTCMFLCSPMSRFGYSTCMFLSASSRFGNSTCLFLSFVECRLPKASTSLLGKVNRIVCGIESCSKIFSDGLEQSCKYTYFSDILSESDGQRCS